MLSLLILCGLWLASFLAFSVRAQTGQHNSCLDATFLAVRGESLGPLNCTPNITGLVYLDRPGDSSFQALEIGWLSATAVPNVGKYLAVVPANFSTFGYGFRLIVVPDENSVDSIIASSYTFAIADQYWDNVFDLRDPSQFTTTLQWSSTGENRILWDVGFGEAIVAFLLYYGEDVTQSPIVLGEMLSSNITTNYWYFTYPGGLPVGSGYQLVVTSSDDVTKVYDVSMPFDIVDSFVPIETQTLGDKPVFVTITIPAGYTSMFTVPTPSGAPTLATQSPYAPSAEFSMAPTSMSNSSFSPSLSASLSTTPTPPSVSASFSILSPISGPSTSGNRSSAASSDIFSSSSAITRTPSVTSTALPLATSSTSGAGGLLAVCRSSLALLMLCMMIALRL